MKNKYALVLVLLTIIISGCSTLSPVDKNIPRKANLLAEDFFFIDGERAIYYTFDLGKKSKNTVIFFISGSGCSSINGRFPDYFSPLKDVSGKVFILQKRGIVDKSSGSYCSSKFYRNDFFDQFYKDQKEFIKKKLQSISFKPINVVVIGASEGATVAAKIAKNNPEITLLGMIGGGGASLREDLRLLSQRDMLFFFSHDRTIQNIKNNPNSLKHAAWGHSYKYWSSILDVDLRDILPKINIPIVSAMGKEDESVPVQTLISLKKTFQTLRKDNLTIKVYPNADHRLFDLDTGKSYSTDFLFTLKNKLSN